MTPARAGQGLSIRGHSKGVGGRRSEKKCSRQKGLCLFGSCPFGYKFVGFCSTFWHCCKSVWG
uniref:Beta-defensin-like domain-containing protein n=1 Tax=Buteo japonicus TaxID=224669 RepID=A0A8C0BJL5_9AVES